MTCRELMIGDYIQSHKQIYRVAGIKPLADIELVVMDISGKLLDMFIDDVEPVLITPEILEKNGFDVSDKEVMQYHFEEDGEKYHFSLRQMYDKDGKPHGYSFYAFNVLTLLDYVHELQHALKLCDINKEIEL